MTKPKAPPAYAKHFTPYDLRVRVYLPGERSVAGLIGDTRHAIAGLAVEVGDVEARRVGGRDWPFPENREETAADGW